MSAQAIVWFVIAAGALFSALRVFNRRFIKKDRYAVGSGGGFVMFGVLMLLGAVGRVRDGVVDEVERSARRTLFPSSRRDLLPQQPSSFAAANLRAPLSQRWERGWG